MIEISPNIDFCWKWETHQRVRAKFHFTAICGAYKMKSIPSSGRFPISPGRAAFGGENKTAGFQP
jgi:hypothetical protein